MNNPFELIETRLINIERILLNIENNLNEKSDQINVDNPLTVKQAAKFLKLAVPTVYSKVSKGEIPFSKRDDSKRLYFFRNDLIEYLKSGRKNSISEIKAIADDYLISKVK